MVEMVEVLLNRSYSYELNFPVKQQRLSGIKKENPAT